MTFTSNCNVMSQQEPLYIKLLLYFGFAPHGYGCVSPQNVKGIVKLCDLNQHTSLVFPQLCHLTPPLPERQGDLWCMSRRDVQWEVAPITAWDLHSPSCNGIKDGWAGKHRLESQCQKHCATLMPGGFIALLSQLQRHNWKLYLICRQCYPVRIVLSA